MLSLLPLSTATRCTNLFAEFQLIVISDFKAFVGKHELVLSGAGVTYIVGENQVSARLVGNGAAKSTIWDALCWCLYGRTPLGLRNNDVKPWLGGKPCVAVTIKVDGRVRIVQRVAASNGFTIDGETAPDVSSVLPMSFELFTNTGLLPQEKPLFFDRSPPDKMELFSETLGLDRWDIRSAAASKAAEEAERKVTTFANEQRSIEGALEELEALLVLVREKSQDWHDAAQRRTTASKGELVTLQKLFAEKDKELAGAILAEDGALTELRASEASARTLRSEKASTAAQLGSARARVSTFQREIERLDDDLAALAEAKACPTCGQAVKPVNLAKHKQHVMSRRAEAQASLLPDLRAVTDLQASHVRCQQKLTRAEADIEAFARKANGAQDVILRVKVLVAELQQKIDAAKLVKEATNPHLAQIASLMERRKDLRSDLKDTIADLTTAQQLVEQVKFWVKGFKDIKLQLIEEVLQELELAANSMIEEVGLEDWEIRFDIERESKSGSIKRMINVQIRSPESKEFVRWESWSGGERQRLRLIGSLALSDVLLSYAGVETNLEVLDEPAVYWSGEGVAELCAFLATRAKERNKSIFFIEHSANESVHFNDVIRVVKDKKGAYLA
jgi:DNA repair exonuclease SbcCD ATPase subunit